jgi:hypothetical protein
MYHSGEETGETAERGDTTDDRPRTTWGVVGTRRWVAAQAADLFAVGVDGDRVERDRE